MSTTSSVRAGVQTLKGIFTEPKITHRRDFLRENKLSLRELQRVGTKKVPQQKPPTHEEKSQKKSFQEQQQQHYTNRRPDSQTCAPQGQTVRTKRAPSQQRDRQAPQTNGQPPYAQHNRGSTQQLHANPSQCASCAATRQPKTSRETQTEEITDEEYLYEALKKCTSNHAQEMQAYYQQGDERDEAHDAGSLAEYQYQLQKMQNADEYDMQRYRANSEADNQSKIGQLSRADSQRALNRSVREAGGLGKHDGNDDVFNNDLGNLALEDNELASPRSKHTLRSTQSRSGAVSKPQAKQSNLSMAGRTHSSNKLNGILDGGEVNNNCLGLEYRDNVHEEQQRPTSARSRQTNCSQQTHQSHLSQKKSTGSVHKLGSRDDIRLPRYLEREKREKEEQRIREANQDPHCPQGHYALSDAERTGTLKDAEKKFKMLVDELNHMPMTNETLRLRSRKMEIEKQLKDLEHTIRLFSKNKVYVKLD